MRLAAFVVAMVLGSGGALAFDCTSVKLPSSIVICSDRELIRLADERQQVFNEARWGIDPQRDKELLADQTGWVRSYATACGVVPNAPPPNPVPATVKECFKRAAEARVAYIRAYGATGSPATAQTAPAATPIVSAGYRAALSAWLESHKRYPESARSRGEEGRAVLRFRVDRMGRVLNYALVGSTGFSDLDASIDAMMRGATLPPFPADMTASDVEVSVTVRFDLASTQLSAKGQPQMPTAAPSSAQMGTAAYAQGAADWDALRAWFDAQAGDRRAGADYWAANRSTAGHLSCAAAGGNYPGDKGAFIAGCQDGKGRLDPIDTRRADPQYRAGFNDEAKRLPFSAGAAPSSTPLIQPSALGPMGQPTARVIEPPPQAAIPPATTSSVTTRGCPEGFPDVGSGCFRNSVAPSQATANSAPTATASAPATPGQTNAGISKPPPSPSPEGGGVLKLVVVIALLLTAISCAAGYCIYRIAKHQQADEGVRLQHRDLPTVGAQAVVSLPIVNGQGKVRTGGRVWLAEGPNLPEGAQVIIKSVQGTRIIVEAANAKHKSVAM
jgi:TonB family protein